MKIYNNLSIGLILFLFMVSFDSVFAQPPVSGIECSYCKGRNGYHKSSCRYYNPPTSSNSSIIPAKASFEQEIAQEILGTMITNLFKNAGKQPEGEKQRQIDEEQRQMKLAALMAEQKRHNDSIRQVRHEKLLKEMKPLEGQGNIAYKPLDNPKPKVNFNCKITSFRGDVRILKANGGGLVSLSENQSVELSPGDYIATGFNGQVKLHYAFEKSGEDILIGQNTVVTIVKEEDGTHIPKKVGNGGMMYITNNKVSESVAETSEKIISEIKELNAELLKEIKKRTVVRCNSFAMSVRGTEFFLTTDSVGNTKVYVLNGLVDVLDEVNSKFVTLTSGNMCTVNLVGVITGLYEFQIDDNEKWWLK